MSLFQPCSVCTKQFPNLTKLQRHLANHADGPELRKFKCNFERCGKAFKFKHHLKVSSNLTNTIATGCIKSSTVRTFVFNVDKDEVSTIIMVASIVRANRFTSSSFNEKLSRVLS